MYIPIGFRLSFNSTTIFYQRYKKGYKLPKTSTFGDKIEWMDDQMNELVFCHKYLSDFNNTSSSEQFFLVIFN